MGQAGVSDATVMAAVGEFCRLTGRKGDAGAAVLTLLSHVMDLLPEANVWREEETRLTILLYEVSLRLKDTSSHATSNLPVRLFKIFSYSSQIEHALYAPEILRDPRLRPSQLRFLFRRSTWNIRKWCMQLSTTLQDRHARLQTNALLRKWHTLTECLIREGVLIAAPTTRTAGMGPRKPPSQSGKPNGCGPLPTAEAARVDGRAIGHILVMLAKFGPVSCATGLMNTIHTHTAWQRSPSVSCADEPHVDSSVMREGSDTVTSIAAPTAMFPLDDADVDKCLSFLDMRGHHAHYAGVLAMLPKNVRRLTSYKTLLHKSTRRATPPERERSGVAFLPGQTRHLEQLWSEAVDLALRQRPQSPDGSLVDLYEARILGHGTHGEPHLITECIAEMEARKLLVVPRTAVTKLSGLAWFVQLAAVKAHINVGAWTEARRLAEELLVDWRKRDDEEFHRHRHDFESFLLNTLLRGLLALGGSSHVPPYRKSVAEGWTAPPTTRQIESMMAGLEDLCNRLQLRPDAITRNIILLAHLRWEQTPLSPGDRTIRDLFIKCGILAPASLSHDASGNETGQEEGEVHAFAGSGLASRCTDDPKEFLKSDASILRALALSLRDRNMMVESRFVVTLLKQGQQKATAAIKAQRKATATAAADTEGTKSEREAH